jgi:hypothetical protein
MLKKKRKQFKPKSSRTKVRRRHIYPVAYKLKAVKLHVDDGVSQSVVA